ncbi:MAG: hypothetical protein WDA22_08655 [Bacteroidota bacterium]
MNKYIILIILITLNTSVQAQDSTRVNESTTQENIALLTITGIMIPMAIAGTIISVLPPSVSIVTNNGNNYGALNFESGIGFGEKRETGVFSDWRMGISYSYVISSHIRNIFRAELKKDFHFDFVDRRKIFLAGFHLSAGLLTDFPNDGYTLGAGAWVKSPWLGYFGFFPQHTFGATYRYNKYFKAKEFHEVSLGITSAFTF